jgi:hypothetical protein
VKKFARNDFWIDVRKTDIGDRAGAGAAAGRSNGGFDRPIHAQRHFNLSRIFVFSWR